MPDDLLALALEQAERSEPTVRPAVLLRIARVESAVDRQSVRKTFDRALTARGDGCHAPLGELNLHSVT